MHPQALSRNVGDLVVLYVVQGKETYYLAVIHCCLSWTVAQLARSPDA